MSTTEARKHAMQVLHRNKGDQTIGWDENNPAEIEQAQATFDSLTSKGYAAYRMTKDGKKGEQIKKFDPKAQRLMLAPPLVGG